jgi:hypothetical protein
LSIFTLVGCAANRSPDEQILFYRTNAHMQQTKLLLVKGDSTPGCHNLFIDSRVHRVAVLGFSQCQVFSEKDCAADSIVAGAWQTKSSLKDDLNQQTEFTQGTRWILNNEGNTDIRSWNCEL